MELEKKVYFVLALCICLKSFALHTCPLLQTLPREAQYEMIDEDVESDDPLTITSGSTPASAHLTLTDSSS